MVDMKQKDVKVFTATLAFPGSETPPDEFDEAWKQYVDTYNRTVNVQAYLKQLDIEIQNRIKASSDQ